jgi:hypothetical protein
MKIVLGVVAGIVVAFLCVLGIEMIGHLAFPPPPGIDLTDPAQVARIMENVPRAALAFVAAAWFIGALAGSWVANRVAGRALAGWSVVVLVLAAGVYTMTTIPHPAWMWAMGIALPLLAGWLAQRLARVPL